MDLAHPTNKKKIVKFSFSWLNCNSYSIIHYTLKKPLKKKGFSLTLMLVWVKNNLHHNYMFQYPIIYWKLISLGLTCTNRHNRSLDYSSGPHTDLILGVVPNCLSWTEVQIPIFCNSFALHHSQKIRFPPRLDSWLMDLLHEATLAAILFSFSNYLLGFAWSASLHRLFFFWKLVRNFGIK